MGRILPRSSDEAFATLIEVQQNLMETLKAALDSKDNRIKELENKVTQLEEYRQLVKVLAGSIEVIKTERDEFETNCRQMVSKIRSMEYEIDYLKNGDESND
jgi:DNA repair exonuclease SbcCD ATPase subunit